MRIRPFRAIRYNPEKVGDLSKVVAPPYDQIDPTTQSLLYSMHPQNVVRISFGRDEPGDDDTRNKYQRAAELLERWLSEGTLIEEVVPAIYLYHSTYRVGGERVTRKGFMAFGELSEYSERVVLPHERTHTKPKEDRLRLLEASQTDLELIFMLYPDPTLQVEALRGDIAATSPLAEASDLRGEQHRLWRVTEPALIAKLDAFFADRSVMIADGHHRYETALEFEKTHPEATHKLMAFFPLEGPGLTILPNHRLVRDLPDVRLQALCEALRPTFEVRELTELHIGEPAERLGEILTARVTGPDRFALVTKGAGHPYLISLRPGAFERIAWPDGTSLAWRRLAVSLLHEGIFRPHLGIGEEALRLASHVDYTASAEEGVRSVLEGRHQAVFLLAPVAPTELGAVVQGGELMPQKSTHFYPKLLTGLVMARV